MFADFTVQTRKNSIPGWPRSFLLNNRQDNSNMAAGPAATRVRRFLAKPFSVEAVPSTVGSVLDEAE